MFSLDVHNKVIEMDMQDIYSRDVDWKEFYNSHFLITGATGMLASYFTLFLIWLNENCDANIRITAIVRSRAKCKAVFGRYYGKEYFFALETDLCNPDILFDKYDYVVHAASLASGNYYISNPVEVMLPNILGTYKLLEISRKSHVKGFLLFSSGAVYGKLIDKKNPIDEDCFGEINPLEMHSCYDESKRAAETMCMAYHREYGVPTKIVRLAHTYAPTMDLYNDPRVFSSFLRCVVERKHIELRSNGESKREFCYCTDAIAAFFLILQNGNDGEAYNVSNMKQFYKISEVAKMVCSLEPESCLNVILSNTDSSNVLENKTAAEVPQNNEKAVKLGCTFKVSLKDGLYRCLAYFRGTELLKRRIKDER